MKLITPSSSATQLWTVLFAGLFAIFSFLGLVVWAGLYLLVGATPFNLLWVVGCALLLGVLAATRSVKAELRERRIRSERAVQIPKHHPRMGSFTYHPYSGRWFTSAVLTTERRIRLGGHGSAPSDDQVATWFEVIIPNVQSILQTASDALLPPPKPCRSTKSTPLVPKTVDFMDDGGFEFSFSADLISDEINLWPIARFSATLELLDAEWEP